MLHRFATQPSGDGSSLLRVADVDYCNPHEYSTDLW